MIFRFALPVLLSLSAVAMADDAASGAAQAAADLQAAVQAMSEAEGARDRVAALTRTIRAHEDGLVALRDAMRRATIRDAMLQLQFDAERDRLARLLGVLSTMEGAQGPLLLLHPAGALATARSGMMLAELVPALQSEVETLRAGLQEARDLRAVQAQAAETLAASLTAAQQARTALSQAMSERTDLPGRFIDDPAALRGLLASADTLEAFAAGLLADGTDAAMSDPAGSGIAAPDFEALKGDLPLPVRGTILRRPGEADAAGVRRPGLLLATRPRALVTAPVAATIRYLGPLLDYGNVMVLEPGEGYLVILAGMETVYGETGQVIAADVPIGLMDGPAADVADLSAVQSEGAAGGGSETLYLEVRRGGEAVDPTEWFTGMQEQDASR